MQTARKEARGILHFENPIAFNLKATVVWVLCTRGPGAEALRHVNAEPLASELVRKSRIRIQRVGNLLALGRFRLFWGGTPEERQGETHGDRYRTRLTVESTKGAQVAGPEKDSDVLRCQEVWGL